MWVPPAIRVLAGRFGIQTRHDLYRGPARAARRRLVDPLFPRYGLTELADWCARLGFGPGRTVLLHSGWERFSRCTATPGDVIRMMLDLLGSTGTLVMPAYPLRNDPEQLFDVRRTPTRAGLLCEHFRRLPGVARSVNFYHSVAALGPHADYLVRDHHKSITPWDEFSPHYRLRTLDSYIVCMGTPRRFGYGIPEHCAESMLRTEVYYFSTVFGPLRTFRYRDPDGQIRTYQCMGRIGRIRPRKTWPYIDRRHAVHGRLSNLRLYSIEAPYLIDRVIELGRQGITNYVDPPPRRELFRPLRTGELTSLGALQG